MSKVAESSTSDNDSCRMIDDSDSQSENENDASAASPWLHEEALKKLPSENTFSGSSILCGACRRFFTGYRSTEVRYKHIRLLATLRSTARRGCRLCIMISSKIDQETFNHYAAPILNIYFDICRPSSEMPGVLELWCHYQKGSKRPEYGSFVQGIKTIRLLPSRGGHPISIFVCSFNEACSTYTRCH